MIGRLCDLKQQVNSTKRYANIWSRKLDQMRKKYEKLRGELGHADPLEENGSEDEVKDSESENVKEEDDGGEGVEADHTGRKKIKTEGRKGSSIKIKYEED